MGYIGTQMSERAMEAHNKGEKPYSQWSKDDLLDCLPSALYEQAKKLTLSELKSELLYTSSWHHTGNCFNRTEFYSIDEENAENLTIEKIDKIIKNRTRKPRQPRVKAKPLYVTARIKYTEWEGRYRNYQRPVEHIEVVQFMSDAKMIKLNNYQTKRLSSVTILEKIEQKTKFADKKSWKNKEIKK